MNLQQIAAEVSTHWDRSALPALANFVRIPNQSPLFDPEWKRHGHMGRAVALALDWVQKQQIAGLRAEVHEIDGRTPLLFIEIDGDPSSTVLMYGHLDKQPPMLPWDSGLEPWTPVLRDGKLYGRGGADDGYAVFAAISALRVLQQ